MGIYFRCSYYRQVALSGGARQFQKLTVEIQKSKSDVEKHLVAMITDLKHGVSTAQEKTLVDNL